MSVYAAVLKALWRRSIVMSLLGLVLAAVPIHTTTIEYAGNGNGNGSGNRNGHGHGHDHDITFEPTDTDTTIIPERG